MKVYASYKHKGQDPIVRKVLMAIAESGKSDSWIQRNSGVTAQTLRNWRLGETKHPQFVTLNAVLRSIGKELTITGKGNRP